MSLKIVFGMVEVRGELVPTVKTYYKEYWVNFARNMITQVIEDIL